MSNDDFYSFEICVWHPNELDIVRIPVYLLDGVHRVKVFSCPTPEHPTGTVVHTFETNSLQESFDKIAKLFSNMNK